MPTSVSKFLGRGTCPRRTRYLNARIRGRRLALRRLEEARNPAVKEGTEGGLPHTENPKNLQAPCRATRRMLVGRPLQSGATLVVPVFLSGN
jgi:hypothetical protein